jgi:hypothetical protein
MGNHLRDLTVGPPGGWHYEQPETHHHMSGITWQALVKKVSQHRQNNNIPQDENLFNEIEEQMCERMSVEDRDAHCGAGARIPKSIGWRQVESFLKTAGAFIASGGQLVDQAEAERRAAICAACPLNVGMHGCGVCRATVDAFRATILQRSTSQDAGLLNCGVCGCENRTQVHIPLETLRAGTGDLDYSLNPACWKRPENSFEAVQ